MRALVAVSALASRIHGYFTDPEIGGFLPRGFTRAYGLTLALIFVAFIVISVLDR